VNLRLSMYYCRRGDLPNGGSYGLRAVQLAPESGRCKSWLASVLELQGNDEGALLIAEEAAVLAPEDPGIMLQVGYFASKLERPAKSTVWLMRVLDRWPDNEVALSLLGKNYLGQSNYLLAREHFEKTVALKPDDVNAWQGLAKACRKLGDEEAAEAAMERVKALGGGGKKDA
jgi:Flp pilus assembly protein TadD